MKRVAPELMHLTLAFIGYVPDTTAAAAAAALRHSLAGKESIACRLGDAGAFPTANRPRVVWVGLAEGAAAVRERADAVREALREARVPFDEKPAVAHLTVARVRDDVDGAARAAIAESLRSVRIESLSFRIDEAILFESKLARSGPTYIPLERVPTRRDALA